MIDLSEITPKALIKINKGTGARIFGTLTTICPFLLAGVSLTIFTENVRIGFDLSSETFDFSWAYAFAFAFSLDDFADVA